MTAAATKNARTIETKPGAHNAPAVVVFGTDEKGKPHASTFDATLAVQATAAARRMGFHALNLDGSQSTSLPKLPSGKIFASGSAFVPFIAKPTYEQLLKLLPPGTKQPLRLVSDTGKPTGNGGEAKSSPLPSSGFPRDWTQLRAGSEVLALEEEGAGWWAAVVVEAKPDGLTFSLRWKGEEKQPPFARQKHQLALPWAGHPAKA